jgi:histidinol-phosphate/aromatic aminotransferase/cobyric acid decarboxylase-like protein
VLLPAPYWLSYPEIARMAGASVKELPSDADQGFRLKPGELEAAITPASRLLVLNSPSNPTGMVLSRAELEAIANVLRRHPQVLVVCDEIYEFLLAPGHTHHSFAAVAPDLADRIFTVNGFAKGWAMTGWRIGWLAGAQEVIAAASALQSQTTSNVCTFAQFGALAAISGSRQCVYAMAAEFNVRRRLLTEGLMAMEGLKLMAPEGAFYAFPDVSHFGLDSITLCNRLLDEVGLDDLRDRKAAELPYGRRRALELATTLALEPELLLLDEPMAGMGHEDVERTSALIRRVAKDRTVLMVEHNLSVVADLSDRITVLARGEILAEGDYGQVSQDPAVIEAYMGTDHD